jgi:hypothetical protein
MAPDAVAALGSQVTAQLEKVLAVYAA